MIRATTPTHIFNLPFETELIKDLIITYTQRKTIIIEKGLDECVLDGKTLAVTLTQKDTVKFSDRRPVEIQLRVLTTSSTALAGDITEAEVNRILNDSIMGPDPEKKPTFIVTDPDSIVSCCCTFDVDFKEVYIVETGSVFPPEYEGEYSGELEFIPMIGEDQIIPTARKYVADDIVVKEIPYAEVDNTSNGRTVTIG